MPHPRLRCMPWQPYPTPQRICTASPRPYAAASSCTYDAFSSYTGACTLALLAYATFVVRGAHGPGPDRNGGLGDMVASVANDTAVHWGRHGHDGVVDVDGRVP
jgi:hypothetical protein